MKRILVVDDEKAVRQMVVDILSGNNRVEAVGTVRAALEKIDENEFDLIISDFNMPDVDGIEFYRTLSKKRSALRHRFLFVTADHESERFRAFLSQTGTRCLAKPFSVPELVETCNSMVNTPPWRREGEKRGQSGFPKTLSRSFAAKCADSSTQMSYPHEPGPSASCIARRGEGDCG